MMALLVPSMGPSARFPHATFNATWRGCRQYMCTSWRETQITTNACPHRSLRRKAAQLNIYSTQQMARHYSAAHLRKCSALVDGICCCGLETSILLTLSGPEACSRYHCIQQRHPRCTLPWFIQRNRRVQYFERDSTEPSRDDELSADGACVHLPTSSVQQLYLAMSESSKSAPMTSCSATNFRFGYCRKHRLSGRSPHAFGF